MNKQQIKDQMRKVQANISRIEIMRQTGQYVPMSTLQKERYKFIKLARKYKQLEGVRKHANTKNR